jgi:hypothetical protein
LKESAYVLAKDFVEDEAVESNADEDLTEALHEKMVCCEYYVLLFF